MDELDDNSLLREYSERGSEEAFALLVKRHVNKVYSAALRLTRNPHLAEEITQAVFVILAKKSRQLGKQVILSGWLYQAARLTAVTFIRSEVRRGRREQEAHMQIAVNENPPDAWTQIAPLLDAAMAGLNETDRHAVVLRFFDGKSMREVAAALGANEDAAKKRVNRALEKLQKFFLKRGIHSTTAIIAGAISANSVHAAPVGLAASVTVAAVKANTVATSTLTLIKTTLKIMAWSKLKTTVAAGAILILAAGTATVAMRPAATVKPPAGGAASTSFDYTTPEASVDSMIRAAGAGDLTAAWAGVSPEMTVWLSNRWQIKTDEDARRTFGDWAKAMAGYKIAKKDAVSDKEVNLLIQAPPSPDGLHDGRQFIKYVKFGNDWKFAGEAH